MTKTSILLRRNLLAFAQKALRELDGTDMSDDRYLEYLERYLMDFATGSTKRSSSTCRNAI